MSTRAALCEETSEPTSSAQGAGYVAKLPRGDWLKDSQHPARQARAQNVIGLHDKDPFCDSMPSLSVFLQLLHKLPSILFF